MKKFLFVVLFLVAATATVVRAATLSEQLSGRILLQVESKGEAWYVNPANQQRYYLGRPDDAFSIMRTLSLGIKHAELVKYQNSSFPTRLVGRILLDVEQNGAAYYISPRSQKSLSLGRPAEAFSIMKSEGLGITNSNLEKITVQTSVSADEPITQQQCLATGGSWGIINMIGDRGCIKSYSDAGKSCTSSNQCEKDCIVYYGKTYGSCQENSNVSMSCHQTIEEYNAGGAFYCQ